MARYGLSSREVVAIWLHLLVVIVSATTGFIVSAISYHALTTGRFVDVEMNNRGASNMEMGESGDHQ